MSNGSMLRKKLFDLYVANGRIHMTDACKGFFACPICLRGYGVDALNPPCLVNIAHVYPRSCGGRLRTLSCVECNSRTSKFEADFQRYQSTHKRFNDPTSDGIKATFFLEGKRMPIRWKASDTNVKIVQEHTSKDSPEANEIAHRMAKGKFEFQMVTLGWNDIHVRVAELHAAYMLMFHWTGYEYLAYCNTQWIRDILMKERHTEDFLLVTADYHLPMPADMMFKAGIAVIDGVKAVFLVFPPIEKGHTARMIFLPGIDPLREQYQRLGPAIASKGSGMKVTVLTAPPIPRLAMPEHRHSLLSRWNELP